MCPMSSSLQVTTSRLSWKRSAYKEPLVQMIFLTGFWRWAPILANPICSIFNSNIRQGSVPAIWKCADVIPVPKVPNPRSNYSDLRPISLTPVLSKILERFVSRWLLHNIRPYSFHFGNTKHCSTTHALIHLLQNWLNALDNSQGVTIRSCTIDFSKAFDKIGHNILLLKLKGLGVPPILLNWCADFLTERNLRVKLGQAKSSWHQLNASVPQGTRLSPIFFLIMINDLNCNFPIYKYVYDCTLYEKNYPMVIYYVITLVSYRSNNWMDWV